MKTCLTISGVNFLFKSGKDAAAAFAMLAEADAYESCWHRSMDGGEGGSVNYESDGRMTMTGVVAPDIISRRENEKLSELDGWYYAVKSDEIDEERLAKIEAKLTAMGVKIPDRPAVKA